MIYYFIYTEFKNKQNSSKVIEIRMVGKRELSGVIRMFSIFIGVLMT